MQVHGRVQTAPTPCSPALYECSGIHTFELPLLMTGQCFSCVLCTPNSVVVRLHIGGGLMLRGRMALASKGKVVVLM